jgi:biopolymer transport protein ExbD
MKFALPPPHKKARIEIIPLIDVIFFCLATFVLVSLSMTRLQGIDVELPTGVSNPDPHHKDKPDDIVKISVLTDGNFAWDTRVMTWSQLQTRLVQYKRECPDPKILINGEENANFGYAIEILDEAHKDGIDKISIKTKLDPVKLD